MKIKQGGCIKNKRIFFTGKSLLLFFTSVTFFLNATAQPKKYSAVNAHAHNDYVHPVPFYTAFHAGFGSIEADVFVVNETLCVAHKKNEVQPQLTLKALYLEPLLKEFTSNSNRHIKLLIDIKESYLQSLPLLLQELLPLQNFLSTPSAKKSLQIIITGNRPPPAAYNNYPLYIYFDDDLKLQHTADEWARVGLVSLQFSKLVTWKAEAAIEKKDKQILKHIIDSVHASGKPIRFWAAPDTLLSWKVQMKLGVDLIGTDKIETLANFIQPPFKK
ncbi:PI-PLC domain-containing protein [Ferruginibacter sp.]